MLLVPSDFAFDGPDVLNEGGITGLFKGRRQQQSIQGKTKVDEVASISGASMATPRPSSAY